MTRREGTRERILESARRLAQTRGLNAFSFHDLARAVGIRTASVHHHFPTKDDLARELMAGYRAEFRQRLEGIGRRRPSPRRRLERFSELFLSTLRDGNRLCLCGMLATEFATLPEAVREEVRAFYQETEGWLAWVLEEGRSTGAFRFEEEPAVVARTFLATLEGAMIAARTFGDEGRLAAAGRWLIDSLSSHGAGSGSPGPPAVRESRS